jgi:beta-barrel assembly-enhancing protease
VPLHVCRTFSAIALAIGVVIPSLISVKDEIALGREAQHQVKRDVPVLEDRAVVQYVARVGRRLVAHAGGPKYPYSFSIANDREINAFALPGGPVWINRGAIEAARNESQLAGVLAHEIAHIARRHAAEQITNRLVTNSLIGLLGAMLGNDSGGARTAQLSAQILAGGYLLKFSRDDEREADRVGVQVMRRAGWDPHGMLEFMEILRREQGRDAGSVATFLSTHPASDERASHLRGELKGVSGGRRNTADFQRIVARLRQIPAHPMSCGQPIRQPLARGSLALWR